MAGKKHRGKKYTAKFKFQVVLEVLQGRKSAAQIAKAYGVHPITLGQWKKELMEKGPEVFGQGEALQDLQKRVRDLERLLGQKEVEIALYKNFLDEN